MSRNSLTFWIGATLFLVAALAMTQIIGNEYPFFACYVILQFIVLAVAWSILGGYAGYVNFGTSAFFGVGVYTAVFLFKAFGAPLAVQIAAAAALGAFLGFALGLLTLRMQGIFFSIATIALTIIIETSVTNWRYVGGAAGIQLQRPLVTGHSTAMCRCCFSFRRCSWCWRLRSRATSKVRGLAAVCRRSRTTNLPRNAPACRPCG